MEAQGQNTGELSSRGRLEKALSSRDGARVGVAGTDEGVGVRH